MTRKQRPYTPLLTLKGGRAGGKGANKVAISSSVHRVSRRALELYCEQILETEMITIGLGAGIEHFLEQSTEGRQFLRKAQEDLKSEAKKDAQARDGNQAA